MTSVSITVLLIADINIFKPPCRTSEAFNTFQPKTRLTESRCAIQFIVAPLYIQYSVRSNTVRDQILNNNSHTQKQHKLTVKHY